MRIHTQFDVSRFLRNVACASIGLLFLAGCAEEAPPKPPKLVKAMQVTGPTDLAQGVFPGQASAGQEANLSFRVPGKLQELPISVGDQVAEGGLLARLDPGDYQNLVNSAQAQVDAAQAAARRAEADYDRLLNVQREDPGATSQRAVDLALAARDEARAAVSGLKAVLDSARDQLEYTELKAPFSGAVVETYVENFETVVALQPIARLLDPTSIELTVSIPENLIGYTQYIVNISVTYDALPGVEIPATVKEIGAEATQATRTYPLTLVMAQPGEGEILPGMAGTATIEVRLPEGDKEAGIFIPASAAFGSSDIEATNVWVIDPTTNILSRREVQTGELTFSGILLTGGLEPGEWIVTAGTHSLSEGQEVKIIDSGDAQ